MALFLESIGHVGLRVVDRERSLAFYAKLGFTELAWYPPPRVSILKNDAGIELNLIVNGEASDAGNVLMDVPEKHPGITHVAFAVANIEATLAALHEAGITVSEGPVSLGENYVALFVRDPDRNVIELGQKLAP